MLLAPAINIDRVPQNGRNFEYFGEDPFLAGRTTVAEVRGIQSNPVVATLKHYAVNNQETDRNTSPRRSDERTASARSTCPRSRRACRRAAPAR